MGVTTLSFLVLLILTGCGGGEVGEKENREEVNAPSGGSDNVDKDKATIPTDTKPSDSSSKDGEPDGGKIEESKEPSNPNSESGGGEIPSTEGSNNVDDKENSDVDDKEKANPEDEKTEVEDDKKDEKTEVVDSNKDEKTEVEVPAKSSDPLVMDERPWEDRKPSEIDNKLLNGIESLNLGEIEGLIEGGANVNSATENRLTPLMILSSIKKQDENIEKIKLLIAKGAKLNIQSNNKSTALILASLEGSHKIVEILLDNGAEVNAANTAGLTPLLYATASNHDDNPRNYQEVVKLLLKHNAKVEMEEALGNTALIFSAKNGYHEIVGLLLEKNPQDKSKDEALYRSLVELSNVDRIDSREKDSNIERIITLLLDKGADPNNVKNKNLTLLMEASIRGRTGVVEQLLAKIKHIDETDGSGNTALMHAVESRRTEVVNLLLSDGANPNVKNILHKTPLLRASKFQSEEIVAQLLNSGADPNYADNNGVTSLMYAVSSKNKKIINLLLEKGALVDVKSDIGRTPLGNANGDKEITKILEEALELQKKTN